MVCPLEENNEVRSHQILTQPLGGNSKCQLEPKHEMSDIRVRVKIEICFSQLPFFVDAFEAM